MAGEALPDREQARMRTKIEVDADAKSFATGLLLDLIAALRRCRPGDLVSVISREARYAAPSSVKASIGVD